MVTNLPDRPPYFNRSVTINLRGAPFFSDRPTLAHLGPTEFNALKQQGATILDVRPAALFGDAHAAGSVNIGVAGPAFSVWCGFFVNPDLPIALVVDYETEDSKLSSSWRALDLTTSWDLSPPGLKSFPTSAVALGLL